MNPEKKQEIKKKQTLILKCISYNHFNKKTHKHNNNGTNKGIFYNCCAIFKLKN